MKSEALVPLFKEQVHECLMGTWFILERPEYERKEQMNYN